MTDLENCPFCGGKSHYVEAVNGSNLIYTGCKSCRIRYETIYGSHDFYDTKKAWNTRTDTERVKVLEDALREITECFGKRTNNLFHQRQVIGRAKQALEKT